MIVIPPGQGEVVGDAPDRRVEILSDDDSVHATWSRFGPRRAGADPHVHRMHADHFYVLEGELTVTLGSSGDVVVRAGELARVPPQVVHGFRNGSDAEVRYLNFHVPGLGFAGFMRALRDGRPAAYDQFPPPEQGARPASEASIGGGAAAERGVLLADAPELGIAEIAAADETQHVHARHVESFYVLDGAVVLTAGDRELHADAGSWVQIPAGVAHAVSSSAPARLLSLHTPNCGFGAFVRGDDAAFDQQPS
jgi:quercetin dioxygenase-like cupin family protein